MSANKSQEISDGSNLMQCEKVADDMAVIVEEDQCNEMKVSENSHECLKKEEETNVNMTNIIPSSGSRMTIPDSTSDFKEWLEGIKMVARLPGGMPVEFRRKLWLALAERYLKRREVDWEIEKVKWFSDTWRADDEELGIQIVKDLHRTGHSLLSGPNGTLNQAKLKRILLGYTRWNPEVGYCQGFNMLGAIILQVMDKNEVDSIKVLIFLIEGLLPNGYFCGSLMGLQVDMAVFRELLGKKLPKLARHLQKLQYPTNEPTSIEPPLINVFTMQWFLTLFCNCLPMTSVLRIWDLIMIEGSDVLLRTALSIWKLLEDRILREVRTADDFYCKMETLMAELSNEHIVDSNVMVQLISDLGPIRDLQKLRHKHLTASYNDQKQLKMMYSKAQGDTERLAVANAWQNNRPQRRGSQQLQREQTDREKIALDITILKKQYDKLRERQKQAHIILTSAVSKQNQQQQPPPPTNVNKLLVGKHAIISKGRKGPPKGAIPPARKAMKANKNSSQSSPSNVMTATTTTSTTMVVKDRETDTLHWKNTDEARRRKNSLTWKEINAESPRKARSDSSSYSENSDSESSTSTSLCDDENHIPSLDSTPVKKRKNKELRRVVMEEESSAKKAQNLIEKEKLPLTEQNPEKSIDLSVPDEGISSISQLSPMPDISSYFSTAISPIKSPSNYYDFPDFSAFSIGSSLSVSGAKDNEIDEQGVTNEFFERVTSSNAFNNNKLPSHENSFTKLKHVHQKSLSVEEAPEKEDLGRINRSFSDGTIITHESGGDIFQKIIAENSKILTKFSNDSLTSSTRTPIVEPILEETKISSEDNSSECEEIAAIDIEECASLDDGIQDITDIIVAHDDIDSKPSTTTNLHQDYDICDVTIAVQNEKSMNGKNSEEETLATLHTTCNANAATAASHNTLLHNSESFAQKSLPLKDACCGEEIEKEAIISPKFNEISELVDKLKKVMESDLQKSCDVVDEKKSDDVVKKEENKIIDDEVKVSREIEVKDVNNINNNDNNNNSNNIKTDNKDEVKIIINNENSEEVVAVVEKKENDLEKLNDVIDTQRLEKCQSTTEAVNSDNEKIKLSNEAKDSAKILEKLNYQLQRYEDPPIQARSPSTERAVPTDYKKDLECLLKEREIERRSKSPTITYRYEDSTSPQPPPPPIPTAVVNSTSSSLYDHEPRNEIRRRDIASLESTQQMRRPFKSSPSSSLSSSPSNIHSTLSSIQNTIKTLDSACQRSEIYNYKKLDKAMESIEKICESDREWHYYKRTRNYESPPSFKIDDILTSPSTSKSSRSFIDERDLSPVKRTSSNFVRYENKPKTPELDPNYIAKLRCLSTEEYIAGRKSPLSGERCSRIDRSPTSPSLSTTRFLKSPTSDRASKSAENSPSRYGGSSEMSRYSSRYSPTRKNEYYSADIKAESMSNLDNYKSTDFNRKYYDFETTSTARRKFDI